MRTKYWIAGSLVFAALTMAGVASSALGSSATSARPWTFSPKSFGHATAPKTATGSKITVTVTDFAATSVDNPPSGTSQGDELDVTGQLMSRGEKVGRLNAHEVLTDDTNPSAPIIQTTGTLLLHGGQISVVGIQLPNRATRLAVVGGTGQYYNVLGGEVTATSSSNNAVKLTLVLVRH